MTEPSTAGPNVFLLYPAANEPEATRLAADLAACGIRSLFAGYDTYLAANSLDGLMKRLAATDYCLLLLSATATDRPWIEVEWPAALARAVQERQAFLFLVQLDDTLPPLLETARAVLDAYTNWKGASDRLVEAWRHDWSAKQRGVHILPAPGLVNQSLLSVPQPDVYARYEHGVEQLLRCMSHTDPQYPTMLVYQQRLLENIDRTRRYGDTETRRAERAEILDLLNRQSFDVLGRSFNELCMARGAAADAQSSDDLSPAGAAIGIYIFNQALGVTHFMHVPPGLAIRHLYARVRSDLALPDRMSALDGQIGLRFSYVLVADQSPLPEQSTELAPLTDGASLDLRVAVEQFGPGAAIIPIEYRDPTTPGTLPAHVARYMIMQAFGHLLPHRYGAEQDD